MRNRTICFIAVISVAVFTTAAANALPTTASGECPTHAALKSAYLACENAAQSGELPTSEIVRCSLIYYDLKDREFGGLFARIREWYETRVALEAATGVGAPRIAATTRTCN